MDVGYYAPAARTTLDRVFLCACLSARLAQSPSTSPSTPSLGICGCVPLAGEWVMLQTGPRHQVRGPLALAPRTSRRTTALLHAPCSSIRAHILPLRQGGKPAPAAAGGGRLAPGGGRRRQGASSIQSQRICLMLPKHMTALRQGVAPRAPKVMLDDAVQAHLGCLRLRRL